MTFEELKADHARLTRALIEAGKEMERMSDTRQVDGGYVLSDAHPTAGHEVVTPEEVAALRADNARMREELHEVDAVLGNRSAFDNCKTRADKVALAIQAADFGEKMGWRLARLARSRMLEEAGQLSAEVKRLCEELKQLATPAPAIIPPYPPELVAVRASGAELVPGPVVALPYTLEQSAAAPQVSLPGPVCLRCHGAGTVVAAGNNTARPCPSCDGRGYDDGLTPDEREEMTALYPRGSGKAVR